MSGLYCREPVICHVEKNRRELGDISSHVALRKNQLDEECIETDAKEGGGDSFPRGERRW